MLPSPQTRYQQTVGPQAPGRLGGFVAPLRRPAVTIPGLTRSAPFQASGENRSKRTASFTAA